MSVKKTGFMKRPDQTSESLFGAKDLEGIYMCASNGLEKIFERSSRSDVQA